MAVNIALKVMNAPDLWNEYSTFEKIILLMPLMHSENGKHTRMCITEAMKLDRDFRSRNLKLYDAGMGKVL